MELRLAGSGQDIGFSWPVAFELPGAYDVCFPFQRTQQRIDRRRPEIGIVAFSDLEYDLVPVHLPSGKELQDDRLEEGFNGLCCLLAEALSPCNMWAFARCVWSALVSGLSWCASDVVSRHIPHGGRWDIKACLFSAPAFGVNTVNGVNNMNGVQLVQVSKFVDRNTPYRTIGSTASQPQSTFWLTAALSPPSNNAPYLVMPPTCLGGGGRTCRANFQAYAIPISSAEKGGCSDEDPLF